MLKTILIIVLIISFGLFALNQSLVYFYNTEFLMQPCELCLELNPKLENCFKRSEADLLIDWDNITKRDVFADYMPS